MGQERDSEGSQVKRGAQEKPRRVPGIPGIGSGERSLLKYGFLGPPLGFEQVLEKVPDYPGRIRRGFPGVPSTLNGGVPGGRLSQVGSGESPGVIKGGIPRTSSELGEWTQEPRWALVGSTEDQPPPHLFSPRKVGK